MYQNFAGTITNMTGLILFTPMFINFSIPPFFSSFCVLCLPLLHKHFVFVVVSIHFVTSLSTHTPRTSSLLLNLPLLGFSGELQLFFFTDRFCVQVPCPSVPSPFMAL